MDHSIIDLPEKYLGRLDRTRNIRAHDIVPWLRYKVYHFLYFFSGKRQERIDQHSQRCNDLHAYIYGPLANKRISFSGYPWFLMVKIAIRFLNDLHHFLESFLELEFFDQITD